MTLDLTKGFGDHKDFKLFKFPGGEIHFKSKGNWFMENVHINTRLNTSDDTMALCIVVDTLRKDKAASVEVFIPYMPYAQADRDFGSGECFSLKTITHILNSLDVDKYVLFDPHSTVAPALLDKSHVMDNSVFIRRIHLDLYPHDNTYHNGSMQLASEKLIWLSPDAGAYTKIWKLAEKIGFKGEILCCQKDRDQKDGSVRVIVPTLPAKDVLIIDDICVGGRTFIEIAKEIKLPKECKRYLAVSHGIFSNGFTELAQYFDNVFTTNSRADSYTTDMFGKVPSSFLKQYKIV